MNSQIFVLSLLVVAIAGFIELTQAKPFNPTFHSLSRFRREAQRQFQQADNIKIFNHPPNARGALERFPRDADQSVANDDAGPKVIVDDGPTDPPANDSPTDPPANDSLQDSRNDDSPNDPPANDSLQEAANDDSPSDPPNDDIPNQPAGEANSGILPLRDDIISEERNDDREKVRVAREADADDDSSPANRAGPNVPERQTKKKKKEQIEEDIANGGSGKYHPRTRNELSAFGV